MFPVPARIFILSVLATAGCSPEFPAVAEQPTPSWGSESPTPAAPRRCAPVPGPACGERVVGDTRSTDATQSLDGYPVAVGNFGGPEIAYTFEADVTEEVVARFIDPRPSELNQDIFVLESDSGDCAASAAVKRGFNDVRFDVVAGRTYTVVVDSPAGVAGEFELELDCEGASPSAERPSNHYWQPAAGCDPGALAGYRSCLAAEGLADSRGRPAHPLLDPFWDDPDVESARVACFDAHPTVAACALLTPTSSGTQGTDGLTADPRNILPPDPDIANDEVVEAQGLLLGRWKASTDLATRIFDAVPDGWSACSTADCPLRDAESTATYGPLCGPDYGALASVDEDLAVAWEQLDQAQWALGGFLARRQALVQALADTADGVDDYNAGVITGLSSRAVGETVVALFGAKAISGLSSLWRSAPKLYDVKRVVQSEVGEVYAGAVKDIAVASALRNDVALTLVEYAVPTVFEGQVESLVFEDGEVVTLSDVAIGLTGTLVDEINDFGPPNSRAGLWRTASGLLKGLPVLGYAITLDGIIDESLADIDGNPYQRVFDLQVIELQALRGNIRAARDARDAALGAVPGLQQRYEALETICDRF